MFRHKADRTSQFKKGLDGDETRRKREEFSVNLSKA
jgi:hypothetical protein